MAKKHSNKHSKEKDTENKMSEKKMLNVSPGIGPWKIATAILALLFILSIFGVFSFDKKISEDEAKTMTEEYLNTLMAGQAEASVNEITEENGLYKIILDVGGREYTSYMTNDGKLLFPQAISLSEEVPEQDGDAEASGTETQTAQTATVPKSDKPEVELFVMSHCPFGTQAEKGIIPAIKTLRDEVDFNIRFVYYAMHGETEVKEQLNQYCIQEEQNSKYLDYLECFLESGNGDECLEQANIDMQKLEACVESTDEEFAVIESLEDQSSWLNGNYPLFNVDSDLNEEYGVGGSPTLIINGVRSGAGRNPASYIEAICGAFTVEPDECDTAELSSVNPSPGFGYDTSGSASAGGCGA
ncbi:hypothetical protein GF345_05210 [Candidatus Woesearchaeota archaeon]|nr:hypothetical protein [Candidatus Woesearchaeota archaeon]